MSPNGAALYAGTAVLVVAVTTVLNLDTSVTFLTPVVLYAARSRGQEEAPLLFGCLLLSNAGSLALPGSNLTNLIVLGHLRLSGGAFFARMARAHAGRRGRDGPGRGRVHRRAFSAALGPSSRPERPVLGVGLLAVAAVTVLVVILRAPAVPVAIVGAAAVAVRALRSGPGPSPRAAVRILGLPVLVGLFLLAVALGTLGRTWAGPATLLGHLGAWGAAATGAVCSVLVNNLPAASLLAAHRPPHPFALLIGLNVGPNLCVTGSLAWILWLRAGRAAGGDPDVGRAMRLGLLSVPLAVTVGVALLAFSPAW